MRKPFFMALICFFSIQGAAVACESHSGALVRACSDPLRSSERWFFDVTQEGVNWETRDAHDAHELHEEGHHVHNKTHEEIYHFNLGVNPSEPFTVLAELPYVVRSSTEVDRHATLGNEEVSEGLGDMKLSLIWRFWRDHGDSLGALVGVKLPTGETDEKTAPGILFEPEMQPGTGSTDARTGLVFHKDLGEFILHGNAIYTMRTEGAHDFEFGDLFATYLSLEKVLNPKARNGRVTLGADMSWQIEERQVDDGHEIGDSGGSTVLLGPSLKIEINDQVAVLGNFLLPVHQDLGGVHQELDFVWNATAKVTW